MSSFTFLKLIDYKDSIEMPDEFHIEKAARKAVRDHCKSWEDEELTGTRDSENYSAYDRIYDAKALNLADKKRFPIAKQFYKELGKVFRRGGPATLIASATRPAEESINPGLLKAMRVYKKTGNRAPMVTALVGVESATKVDAVGVLKFALEVKASSSPEQSRAAKALMRFMAQHELLAKYPDLMSPMKPWLEENYGHFHSAAKANKMKPGEFVKANRATVFLLLPRVHAEVLVRVTDNDYTKCPDSVIQVVTSSDLGMRLYGFAVEQVVASKADAEIAKDVIELSKASRVNLQMLSNAKKQTLKRLQAMDGIAFLPERRKIVIQYRGRQYPGDANSLWHSVEVQYDAMWKGRSVGCGDLCPLFCESALVEDDSAGHKGQFATNVLLISQTTRESMNRQALAECPNNDGLEICELLEKKVKSISVTDETFEAIEQGFFKAMLGEAGQKVLERKVGAVIEERIQACETQKVEDSLDLAICHITKLQNSELYNFTGPTAQGIVRLVLGMLVSISEQRPPAFARNPCSFLTSVAEKLVGFCVCSDGSQKKMGRAAVLHLAKKVSEASAPDIAELKQAVTFGWVLDAPEKHTIESLLEEVQNNGASSLAGAAQAVSGHKSKSDFSGAGSASPKKKQRCTEMDAALAMFM